MRVATRLLLLATVMYQGWGLNALVVEHWSHAKSSLGLGLLTVVDVLNCVCLGACVWLAYFAIRWMKLRRKRLSLTDHELTGNYSLYHKSRLSQTDHELTGNYTTKAGSR